MAEMGCGYGSECHLLRYMGRHRNELDKRVASANGASAVRWIDFHFDKTNRWHDGERKGLNFLPAAHPALVAWQTYWPRRGTPPNWDAVGLGTIQGSDEWLLMEAKAHVGEMKSNCGAREDGGLSQIREALDKVKSELGVPLERDWLKGYYQLANRLALLSFLVQHDVPGRLLLLYFVGDTRPDTATCPQNEEAWRPALLEQDRWLGLEREHKLSDRIHHLFVPVALN